MFLPAEYIPQCCVRDAFLWVPQRHFLQGHHLTALETSDYDTDATLKMIVMDTQICTVHKTSLTLLVNTQQTFVIIIQLKILQLGLTPGSN